MALASSSLKQGFGSWPENESRSHQREHCILATRPMVSDKAPGLQLCGKEFPQWQKVVNQVKCLLGGKKSTVCVDRHKGMLREAESCFGGSLKSLIWGTSSWFPLANHFDLPGSESVFGISQDTPMCVHIPLSQDEFYWRGLWEVSMT